MTTSRCVGEPVSWLRLERFRLGELGGTERESIAAHLAACSSCAACLARIEADEARELPALALGPAPTPPMLAPPVRSPRRRLFASVAALAAAAVVVLGIGRTWRSPGSAERETARPKGDGMAFVLVRDDGERVVDAQGVFRDGDRFKALVTCPPGSGATFDLVVFDAGGASFPLSPARGFACGNEVPLPGAFRLTSAGDHETVCVVWGRDDDVDRGALIRSGVTGRRAMCKDLRPVGAGN
jgi:hypothetical protein